MSKYHSVFIEIPRRSFIRSVGMTILFLCHSE